MLVTNSFYLVYLVMPRMSLACVLIMCWPYRLIVCLSMDFTRVNTTFDSSFTSLMTLYEMKFSSTLELSNVLSVYHPREVSMSIMS